MIYQNTFYGYMNREKDSKIIAFMLTFVKIIYVNHQHVKRMHVNYWHDKRFNGHHKSLINV